MDCGKPVWVSLWALLVVLLGSFDLSPRLPGSREGLLVRYGRVSPFWAFSPPVALCPFALSFLSPKVRLLP